MYVLHVAASRLTQEETARTQQLLTKTQDELATKIETSRNELAVKTEENQRLVTQVVSTSAPHLPIPYTKNARSIPLAPTCYLHATFP